jgi:hypothetical protein
VPTVHTDVSKVGCSSCFGLLSWRTGNILVGTLLALSSVIISLTKPGGWLCLSGIRPDQVEIVKK